MSASLVGKFLSLFSGEVDDNNKNQLFDSAIGFINNKLEYTTDSDTISSVNHQDCPFTRLQEEVKVKGKLISRKDYIYDLDLFKTHSFKPGINKKDKHITDAICAETKTFVPFFKSNSNFFLTVCLEFFFPTTPSGIKSIALQNESESGQEQQNNESNHFNWHTLYLSSFETKKPLVYELMKYEILAYSSLYYNNAKDLNFGINKHQAVIFSNNNNKLVVIKNQ